MTASSGMVAPGALSPGALSLDGSAASAGSALSIVHLYPTLLGLYGDRGNALVLAARARARGIDVELVTVDPGEAVPQLADVYLVGGGEDGAQTSATELLRADGGLVVATDRNAVVLAVCAGLQVLGTEFAATGGSVAGLGIVDAVTTAGAPRAVGELLAEPDALPVPTLTGFENHAGRTTLGPGVRPLGRVVHGIGNGVPVEGDAPSGDGPHHSGSAGTGATVDGYVQGHLVGTYLHGPVLARNPQLADLLLHWATGLELAPLDHHTTDELRSERLAVVRAGGNRGHGWRSVAASARRAVRNLANRQ